MRKSFKLRCPLDAMFRNNNQISSSPPAAGEAFRGNSMQGQSHHHTLLHANEPSLPDEDRRWPQCRQFLEVSEHFQRSAQLQGAPSETVRIADSSSSPKEIREYNFLRCIEEGSAMSTDTAEVDCTLHLGTASTSWQSCDRSGTLAPAGGSKFPSAGLPQSIDRLPEISAGCQLADNSMLSMTGALQSLGACTSNRSHSSHHWESDVNLLDDKFGKDTVPSIANSVMWRSESTMTLLRENVQDLGECGSSSRTSSNSSGNTVSIKPPLITDKPMMNFRVDRDRLTANYNSNHPAWFHYNQGGFSSSQSGQSKMRLDEPSAPYNIAGNLSAGGAFPSHVFTGSKAPNASNAKEGTSYVIRICAQCKTMRTPLWRNGPQGPKSLCNACGIRYKKEERRSAAVEDTNNRQQDASDERSRFIDGSTSEDTPHTAGEGQARQAEKRPKLTNNDTVYRPS